VLYNITTGAWVQKSPLLMPRSCFGAGVLGGKPYAAGGYVALGQDTPTVEYYDLSSDTWSRAANMGVSRSFFVTVTGRKATL